MPRAIVEGTKEVGFLSAVPPDPDLLAALVDDMAPLRPSRMDGFQLMTQGAVISQVPTSVGAPAEVLLELAGIKAAIRTWYQKDPDQVLREASAYSARLSEVWTELRLLESTDRRFTQMRTMQVTPVLDEIDRQLRINQSRIAMLRQDIDMLRGAGT